MDVRKQEKQMNFLNRSQQRTTLRVVVEKIGKASAVVHGDLSKETLKELLMSELSLIPETKSFEKKNIKTISGKEISEAIDQEIEGHVDLSKNGKRKEDKNTNSSQKGNEEEKHNKSDTQVSENENEDQEIDLTELYEKTKLFKGKMKEDKQDGKREKLKYKKNIHAKYSKSFDRNSCAIRKSEEILNEFVINEAYIKEGKEEENLNLSEDSKWLKKYFNKPLILAIKEIIEKKPSDPVNYLGFWFLNYRSSEKKRETETCLEKELLENRNDSNINQIKKTPELILETEDKMFFQEEKEEYADDRNLVNYDIK